MISSSDLQVEKRGGNNEPFNSEKIRHSVIKAGANPEVARSVAIQVESWAKGYANDGMIKSGNVRTKVIETLYDVNPKAARAYESYKKM